MPLQHLIFPSLHVLERSSHVAFIKSTRDFPLYNFSYSLCFELHLGTLLLLAPVVSLQYLVRSYKYSCIIYVCPHAISILQISPYSLLMFDNNSSCHNTYPSQNGVPIVDTRRRATAPAFFVYLTKKVFSRLGETQILLESPSSNLRELEIPN